MIQRVLGNKVFTMCIGLQGHILRHSSNETRYFRQLFWVYSSHSGFSIVYLFLLMFSFRVSISYNISSAGTMFHLYTQIPPI